MSASTPAPTSYVTRSAWTEHGGRDELVDDIADQFERPEVLDPAVASGWPQRPRAWRAA